MTVSKLDISRIPELLEPGRAFWKEGKLPGNLNAETFVKTLTQIVAANFGVVYAAEENGKIVGGFAGSIMTDFLSGDVVASEIFWYIEEGHRGAGLQMWAEFEKEAVKRGAKRLLMLHLMSVNSDILPRLYERRGYRLLEQTFVKEL